MCPLHQSTQADVKRCLSQTSSSSRLEQQLAALTSEVSQLSARLDALQVNEAHCGRGQQPAVHWVAALQRCHGRVASGDLSTLG